jgi:hypothetical protein
MCGAPGVVSRFYSGTGGKAAKVAPGYGRQRRSNDLHRFAPAVARAQVEGLPPWS